MAVPPRPIAARTRSALLESARGLSRYGYGNLVLEQVTSDAGYTRGALYQQFKDKQELTLAVIDWALETWRREVGRILTSNTLSGCRRRWCVGS